MTKIIDKIKCICGALSNIVSTPVGYRFDYLLSLVKPAALSDKPIPWMNYEAVDYIASTVNPNARIFEYGSGSSTLFWMTRCLEIVSIEHDRDFYSHMSAHFGPSVQFFLIAPEFEGMEVHHDPASTDLFQSSDFKGYSFERYVKSIDNFQDGYFDMVVVDGRARPSCMKRAISKIKSGGLLVVDNSDREYYWLNTLSLLEGWQKKVFRGTVRGLRHREQTTVCLKP